MAAKSWIEKFEVEKSPLTKTIEKNFADMPAGSVMHISTPKRIRDYIRQIPPGHKSSLKTMRTDLAMENNADNTCPVTTGIFLRIVTEAAHEEHQQGTSIDKITPFWRVVDQKMALTKKLTFDPTPYFKQLEIE